MNSLLMCLYKIIPVSESFDMKFFNELNALIGGEIHRVFEIDLEDQCVEEHVALPSGDVARFTHDGIFSEKGLWFSDDVEFMNRNPSFEIVAVCSRNFIDRTGKTTVTRFVVTY